MVKFIWSVALGLLGLIFCTLLLSIFIMGIINSINKISKRIKGGK